MQVKNKIQLIYLFSILAIINACRPKSLAPEDWIKWAENANNGLKQKIEMNQVKYMAMYKPPQYLQAKANLYNEKSKVHSGLMEFNIRMEPIDGKTNVLAIGAGSKEEALARVEYYNYLITNDIKMIMGSDTIYPANIIYERYYNLSPAQTLVVGFDIGNKKIIDFTLIVEDKIINTGKMQFHFENKTLSTLPKLII